MRRYRLLQIDAFTDRPLEGNACAVVLDADSLAETEMLAIAREMNLSETAFVLASERADVAARYFTPAEEIPLAGHPTLATVQALIETGRLGRPRPQRILLELRAGLISVEIGAGERPLITMNQLAPTFGRCYAPAQVLPAFGLNPEDALPGAPIETVSTGTPQLMIPLRGPAPLARAALQPALYRALRASGDFFSPHLFCVEDGGAQTHARHFGTPPDLNEDPFTGSATGGMGAYLWRHGLIDEPRFTARQGDGMGRPGRAEVQIVGPPDAIETVRVGGTAVPVLTGELQLPARRSAE